MNANETETDATITDAYENVDGWVVYDSAGMAWTPDPDAAEQISAAADPRAEAIRICTVDPMAGTWRG